MRTARGRRSARTEDVETLYAFRGIVAYVAVWAYPAAK